MKGIVIAAALATLALAGVGVSRVAADSYSVTSVTSVNGGSNGVCASTSLQVRQNGQDVVNRSASQCAP